MKQKRKSQALGKPQLNIEDDIQHDVGILPQSPPQSSSADKATDEMLKGLENADHITRAARLAGSEH